MESLDWSKLKTWCRGRLPHWEVPGMTAFLTFRLADSLPIAVVRAYDEERRVLERRLAHEGATPELRRDARLLFGDRIERALDRGQGTCLLRRPDYARLTMDAVRFFDGDRYLLHAVCLMPNHVHAVATLAPEARLSEITHGWKSFTANRAQRLLGHRGALWQPESYDHVVRDEGELDHYVRYTLDNPKQAGLADWPHVYAPLEP